MTGQDSSKLQKDLIILVQENKRLFAALVASYMIFEYDSEGELVLIENSEKLDSKSIN
jgi:hypothetical protein